MRYVLVLLAAISFLSCDKKTTEVPYEWLDEGNNQILNPRLCEPKELIRNLAPIEGYTNKQSYAPGESVFFFIHSRTPEYTLELFRFGQKQESVYSTTLTNGTIQNYLCYAYSWGCDWEQSHSYTLPSNLESGIYSAYVRNDLGDFWITFVVKPTAKKSDVAVIASTNTWCAYNDWGGGSFYTLRVEPQTPYSENITFQRPNKQGDPFKSGHLVAAELHLLRWLEKRGTDYDMYCDRDLHLNPEEIKRYKVIVIQVHPEYYSTEMYDAIQDYVDNGGNLMYLGGNGVYAKVVYNPVIDRLEVRKKGDQHYYVKEQGGLWRNLNRSESGLLGVEYTKPGYNTYFPYRVSNYNHWVFFDTGLYNGRVFGDNCGRGGASGHETDKVTSSSPSNMVMLAKGTNPDNGGADMIYYETAGGGKVFSVGSITFTSCLEDDPIVSKITGNVFTEFLK